nr:mucin-2-like isoform X1 [Cherax quadricarinatus]
MVPRLPCLLLLAGLTVAASGLIIGDEGPPGTLTKKSPIYFPVLLDDFQEFPVRLGVGKDLDSGIREQLPATTSKPTTTTIRLPLNPDGVSSHVALEVVTHAPGPSYLTDSYYYLDDHTPLPGSTEKHSSEEQDHDLPELDREGEDQELQSLTPHASRFFSKKKTSTALFLVDDISTPAPITPIHGFKTPIHAPDSPVQASGSPTRTPGSPTRTPGSPTRAPDSPTRTPGSPTRALGPPIHPPAIETQGPTRQGGQIFESEGPGRTATSVSPTRSFTRPQPPPPSPSPKPIKLRPAYTPIPTPAPSTVPSRFPATSRARINYTPSRAPSQDYATPSTPIRSSTTRPTTVRLVSRRPSFESSRLSGFKKPFQTTAALTGARRTPTPPTTTTSRDYGRRTSPGINSGRQRLSGSSRGRVEEAPVYRTSTTAYRAPSSLYNVRGASTTTVTAPAQPDFIQSDPNIYVPVEYDEEAIPGEAGLDYPVYDTVPDTGFSCVDQEHPGLYADVDAKCQTFHICQDDGRQDSFLCPNGTVFNQQYFVCDWWYNFACDQATRFYSLNALLYVLPDTGKYARK